MTVNSINNSGGYTGVAHASSTDSVQSSGKNPTSMSSAEMEKLIVSLASRKLAEDLLMLQKPTDPRSHFNSNGTGSAPDVIYGTVVNFGPGRTQIGGLVPDPASQLVNQEVSPYDSSRTNPSKIIRNL